MRRAIEEAIPADATRALREAGRRLAVDAESALADALNGATLENLSVNDFWVEVSGYFDAAGWGRIEYEALSDGLGAAVAHDWAESDPSEARDAPGCHISTGLLAELLTRVAGEPVAVLEANCRSRGDDACRFIFGSPTNLMALHGHLSRGRTLDEALAEAS